MKNIEYFDIEIDKLTNSIENRSDGHVYDTEVILLSAKDKNQIKKADWRFNWHTELSSANKKVYKFSYL